MAAFNVKPFEMRFAERVKLQFAEVSSAARLIIPSVQP